MGHFPTALAARLQQELDLKRAIETGTYQGGGALALAEIFERVVTIELSPEIHALAATRLADVDRIDSRLGDSRTIMPELVDLAVPTFYWLDGHWSGGATGGTEAECPVLDELASAAQGHPDDCIAIDDARLFLASPPPPHDPSHWPTLVELLDALRVARPDAHITLAGDIVVAVPGRARAIADEWARAALDPSGTQAAPERAGGLRRRLAAVLDRRS